MKNLALFDFDGTITTEDTFTKFLFYSTPKLRLYLGLLIVWPVILLYKVGWLPACRTRPILSFVAFWRRDVQIVEQLAQQFSSTYLPTVIREVAQRRLELHKQCGDDIYLVSAGLNLYLQFWCQSQGIELVCSTLEQKQGRFTGRYQNGDCSHEHKVRLLTRRVDTSSYVKIYAYGDTLEDLPMLRLAHDAYLDWRPLKEIDGHSIKAS
tara:strand:- start:5643 stop:6269 length:627 start_codon:yes stop_codon:yes gene_type:complete